ncbi:hypothetical protein EUTSA_v10026571mg [Eutrema salsugineum]|uniref:Uncharacterized protein n=1 Tax=Eutrema salsugineum TaxID=72664 RepID=V4LX74_EUTSA|nr:hypothetical protein EUTSA_v10026571mg [Eutrema salsugineum]
MLTETPFRPREKLLEKQRLFQSIHRHTYLKGPMDKITSVAIPIALAASSLYMIICVAGYREQGSTTCRMESGRRNKQQLLLHFFLFFAFGFDMYPVAAHMRLQNKVVLVFFLKLFIAFCQIIA